MMTLEERKEYLEDLTKEAIGEFRGFRVFNDKNLREWLNEDELDDEEYKLTEDEYNELFDAINWYLYTGEEVA